MRRGALIAVAAVVTVAGIFAVLLFFSGRDDSTLGVDDANAPGQAAPSLTAPELERGNVVLRFAAPADREVLRALADEFGPESLTDQGQAVIVRRDPGSQGVVAEAYKRTLTTSAADDPQLRAFVEYWLGRGKQ